ncbi:hypothetical protein KY332_01370 [Candidatus Woesearchaeota archaeon]|nr:hypothetical protein [Candidatus Woesearchaeota archaeon]
MKKECIEEMIRYNGHMRKMNILNDPERRKTDIFCNFSLGIYTGPETDFGEIGSSSEGMLSLYLGNIGFECFYQEDIGLSARLKFISGLKDRPFGDDGPSGA